MNSNNENNAGAPTEATETEANEAARVSRETEAATATNAEAAASEAATGEGEAEEAEATEAKQIATGDLIKLGGLGIASFGTKVQQSLDAAAEHLEAIRKDQQKVQSVAEANDEVKKVRGDLWAHVLAVVEIVANATADVPTIRDLTYSAVMGEFLKSEKATTAKAYTVTGRAVLVKLLTDRKMDMDKVREMSYANVRDTLRVPTSPDAAEAAAIMEKVRDQLGFITRNADKLGGDSLLNRVNRIAEAVEREYNPVKAAKDANSAKAKAAKALAELKQQSPREAGTVETTAAGGEGDVKPEVARRAQDERQRQVFKSQQGQRH